MGLTKMLLASLLRKYRIYLEFQYICFCFFFHHYLNLNLHMIHDKDGGKTQY